MSPPRITKSGPAAAHNPEVAGPSPAPAISANHADAATCGGPTSVGAAVTYIENRVVLRERVGLPRFETERFSAPMPTKKSKTPKKPRTPKLRLHKGSGQALVEVEGRRIYLGK